MRNNQKPTKSGQYDTSPVLKRVRKSVYKQALLAGLLIVLTVVILFAMTAAWYTNIVQSSGLVFEAAVWGFEGTVTLSEAGISAAPGDEGVVELIAESESTELTAVSLNVSRAQMDEDICKRIYFYIDTSKVRNNEIMDRIYLSNQDSYTYLLFSNQTLMLTETVHNDALLKWHWVYDVLGYYVQGTLIQTADSDTGTIMNIAEYLRPIEYEFDEARTTFVNGNGQLLTTDGITTVEKFLTELSAKDGYAGVIDVTKAVTTSDGRIYYPVAVDKTTGTGVWAYLCTYSEIKTNTEYDTNLGQQAAQGIIPTYTATLTISAQNSKLEAVQVSTPAALENQIAQAAASGTKTVIQLADNITLTEPLVIGGDATQQIMLDLNGKTLTVDSGTYNQYAGGIQVGEGSSLTIINGDLVGTGKGFALSGAGVEITLSDVDISGVETALYIRDHNADGMGDSRIRLSGCTIDCSEEGIYLSGNGTDSAQTTQLVVEDTVITSGYIGIMGNGNNEQSGTDIQIIRSTVSGTWAGVYQPQRDSILVISDSSVITGYTGLVLKAGTAQVLDSKIHGTGTGIGAATPTVSLSGFCDTGDAIYIEANYGGEITLIVSGNSVVTSENKNNFALRVYPDSGNVRVTINGGCFSSNVSSYCGVNAQQTGPDGNGYYWVSGAVG